MRRLVLLALALVSLLAALFFLSRERPTHALHSESAPSDETSRLEPAEPVAAEEQGPPAEPDEVREEVTVEPSRPEAAPPAECIVIGTVLDEDGRPLAQVNVQLSAYQVWAADVDVPRLEGRYDMRGFELETEADGSFRFETPVPSAPRTVLRVRPERFHDSHTVYFDSTRDSAQPGLTAGVRDLGEIRLATTGALRGRVVDRNGAPLADVNVDIGPGRSTTYSRDAYTDADGTYVVAHAPIGTYAIKAKLEGFLSGHLEPVTVERQRDTQVPDFVLEPAPSIEGIVRDELGAPLADVRLYGWPRSSGSGAGARSGEDGRFVIHLPQDEPYSLGAKRDGYRTWGDENDDSTLFEPGTRDLEIVMHSMPRTRFTVVDAETGEPIERFGLNILEDNGSLAPSSIHTERRRPRPKDRPGGVAEATAREGIDLYVVSADGYLLATGDVELDQPGSPVQTVRLQRGATLSGRVLRDGEPVAGVLVEVVRGWMRELPAGLGIETERGVFRASGNTQQSTRTDEHGRFAIDALDAGTHRLTVTPVRGAPRIVVPIELRPREDRELGDLTLTAGAAIAGNVLVPGGIDPAGLEVYLDDWRDDRTAVTDARGQFRFEELAPGPHSLTLKTRPGVLAGMGAVQVELLDGQTTEVTLDARDREMCAVTLSIDVGGLPVNQLQVDLRAEDGTRTQLGHCDERGVVSGSVLASGKARVCAWLPGGRELVHPDVVLDLVQRGRIEREVRFELASLAVRLPAATALPTNGHVRLSFGPNSPLRAIQHRLENGKPARALPTCDRIEPDSLVFGALTPGEFDATLELVESPQGGLEFSTTPYFTATRRVVLVADEELVVTLD